MGLATSTPLELIVEGVDAGGAPECWEVYLKSTNGRLHGRHNMQAVCLLNHTHAEESNIIAGRED